MIRTPEAVIQQAPPAPDSLLLEQSANPDIRARLEAVDIMLFRIALDCDERIEDEQFAINKAHAERRQLLREAPDDEARAAIEKSNVIPRLPKTYKQDMFHVEANYAYSVVDTTLSLVERAKQTAAKRGRPAITEVVISTDLDGTQVPLCYDDSNNRLRGGTVPAVLCLNEMLNPDGIVVKLDTHSDRAQHEQEHGRSGDNKSEPGHPNRRVATLFHELDEAGLLDTEGIVSTKDGALAKQLPEDLKTQRGRNRKITSETFRRRAVAISTLISRRTFIRQPDAFHEKAVVGQLRVRQDPPTRVRVIVEDLSYAKYIRPDSTRVAGVHIKWDTRENGGLQPLTYDDIYYYPS